MKKRKIGLIAAIMVLTAAVTYVVTYVSVWHQFDKRLLTLNEKEVIFNKLTEINGYIDSMYIMEYDAEESADDVARAMMESLPDGWSYYSTKEEMDAQYEQQNAQYAGIGANCMQIHRL